MYKYKGFLEKATGVINKAVNDIKDNKPFFINTGPNTENILETGALADLRRGVFDSYKPKVRKGVIANPKATILIKKKAFSTLKASNDLRWMDRTEKFVLRATKALFAYKVQQIRAYEALHKFENSYEEYSIGSINLLYSLLSELDKLSFDKNSLKQRTELIIPNNNIDETFASFLTTIKDIQISRDIDGKRQDIISLLKRNVFSLDNNLTTWIVDPDNVENYSIGPGTGVIELGLFSTLSCSIGIDSNPKSGSFDLYDPYNISNISEDDIDFAVEEAFYGSYNLLKGLIDGSLSTRNNQGNFPSINSRELSSIALQAAGLGDFDKSFDLDYVRDRLRTFYLGRSIVNPADGVHFYISSQRRSQNTSLEDADSFLNNQENEISDVVLESERILFTSGKLTLNEYKKIRSNSTSSFDMVHVFGGYIKDTSTSYNSGAYTLRVNCVDNMGWLSWSRYAQTPALQDYVGPLEDPLTPFQYKTDEFGKLIYPEGFELLEENKLIMEAGLVSYNSGLFRGRNATEQNLFQGEFNDFGSLKGSKVIQHPDGFIYRWKQGILSLVTDFQIADPTGNSQRETKLFTRRYGVSVVNNIVTNLDVANILSVIITGQPYNAETFLQRAYEAHNISSTSTNLNSQDPLTIVLQTLRKQNFYYGNFRPYRTITMNQKSIQRQIYDSNLKNSINGNLRSLQDRKFKIINKINSIKTPSGDVLSPVDNVLIATLEAELVNIENTISKQINQAKDAGVIPGVLDGEYKLTLDLNKRVGLDLDEDEEKNEVLTRAMMKVGQLRRIEDVRLNRDSNLFVVSDQYDYNNDIRPFLLNLKNSNFNLFTSDYTDAFQTCNTAVNTIKFEFFCNSQGHLEFRPPQWNKTPLTILDQMARIQRDTKKKIIPDFIESIFEDRVSALERDIQAINISIVIGALLLGRFPDKNLIPGMTMSGLSSLKFFGVRSPAEFLSKEDGPLLKLRGSSVQKNVQRPASKFDLTANITFAENGRITMGDVETTLGEFDAIFQEKSGLLNKVLSSVASPNSAPAAKYATASNLNKIRDDFANKVGIDPAARLGFKRRQIKEEDFVFKRQDGTSEDNQGNLYKSLLSDKGILRKISNLISERDRMVTILRRNTERQRELEELEGVFGNEDLEPSTDPNTADTYRMFKDSTNKKLSKLKDISDKANAGMKYLNHLKDNPFKGSMYDHLIEDDTTNILGYGSSKRFIIEDKDIISATFNETPPAFTRVSVKGDAPLNLGQQLNSSSEGLYFFAGATDFDLWRQYGYVPTEITAPFLTDSEAQCKPYAIFQLQMARAGINTASLNVVGNEFYQPGDVVYIKSKNLLYYVDSVSHSFTFGQQFSTTLSLKYGHAPGSYLPSPLDIIGQQFSTDPLKDKVLNYRNFQGDDDYRALQPDSTILLPIKSGGAVNLDKSEILSFRNNQSRFGNMMIDLSGSLLAGSRYLLLRVFVNGRSDGLSGVKEDAMNTLNAIQELFLNPEQVEIVNDDELTVGNNLSFEGLIEDAGSVAKSIFPVKKTKPLTLPNSIQPSAINKDKILMQIVFLNKNNEEESSNEDVLVCMNNKLADKILDSEGRIVDSKNNLQIGNLKSDNNSIFPSGGPTQTSWLDLRDLYGYGLSSFGKNSVSRLVEIGIIDLSNVINRGSDG